MRLDRFVDPFSTASLVSFEPLPLSDLLLARSVVLGSIAVHVQDLVLILLHRDLLVV